MALGVATYFALAFEPVGHVYFYLLLSCLFLARIGRKYRNRLGPICTGFILAFLGFCAAGARTDHVAGPVLDHRYYGPIEGRIVAIDRSASDKLRLTLDQVHLPGLTPPEVPRRVRISLHGDQPFLDPWPGQRIATTGHLSPPEGPGEPNGFDFQRHAWFQSIGGVGYTRNPVLVMAERPENTMLLATMRARFSRTVQARVNGEAGAFAAAVLTGDRSGIPVQTLQTLRHSNIAHLLAISGLHMGLLTGFVFLSVRGGLALVPPLALRIPTKKWAAVAALAAGGFYLALSGGNVATERAFIQVAVMFFAVLIDRRAVTLRSVAIAALIVLLHRPDSLLGPGFQMSFAATTALVAVFNALKTNAFLNDWPKPMRALSALVLSSLVAGLATAPFAAAHFNIWVVYGLPANLLTVPVMGSLVIPAAVVALLLWPLGLEWIAFAIMERGLNWILGVAAWTSDLPGAVRPVPMPDSNALPLIALGALVNIIWQGRTRFLGAVPVLTALAFWIMAERPDILISSSGRLVGIASDEGRALSRERGDGFVARLWLENDGDFADQLTAAARPLWQNDTGGRSVEIHGLRIWHGVGRRAEAALEQACADHDWVITSETSPNVLAASELSDLLPRQTGIQAQAQPATGGGCLFIGPEDLSRHGAFAITFSDGVPQISTAHAQQGRRPWVPLR